MQKGAMISISFIISLVLLIIPFASAELSISSPQELYNAGDSFSLNIKIIPSEETSSFLASSLLCSGDSVEIFKSPLFLSAGEEKTISLSSKFDPFLIQDLEGTCLIQASFGEETANTETFTLSRSLIVNATIEKANYNPGEVVVIIGNAVKETGSPISGIVEVSSEKIPSSDVAGISEGSFTINFAIPENTPAGSNIVLITAFEKTSKNETLNKGTTALNINVNQVPKEIDIALNSQTISPNNEFKYKILILDQISTEIQDSVSIIVTDSRGKTFLEQEVQSSSDLVLPLETTSPPGEWTVIAKYKDKEVNKQFTIEELKDLSYKISEDKLTVTNTGNVYYEDNLEINVGEETKSFKVSLAVGKSKVYKLSAPNGDYDISVSTPEGSKSVGSASLTGKAVSVSPTSLGFNSTTLKILIGIVIIILIALLILYLRKKMKSGHFKSKKQSYPLEDKTQQDFSKEETILDGKKQHSTLIALKIKNQETLRNNKEANDTINSALLKAKEGKAKIYVSENYRIIILSPLITKNKENEIEAVSIAGKIREIITKFNKHSNTKIRYGIGIHSGELVLESDKGQSKFISLGNTISMAKKISESSESDILVSEPVRKKILGKIRAEKVSNKLWKISELKSKYKYEEFIKRFEQRRRESGKKE